MVNLLQKMRDSFHDRGLGADVRAMHHKCKAYLSNAKLQRVEKVLRDLSPLQHVNGAYVEFDAALQL